MVLSVSCFAGCNVNEVVPCSDIERMVQRSCGPNLLHQENESIVGQRNLTIQRV